MRSPTFLVTPHLLQHMLQRFCDRCMEGVKVPEAGWVGSDSRFGSVLSANEVKKWFGMNSTWVIKQNSDYFPMMAIYSALNAWYGDKPSGHWVVFQTEISGVKLLAIGYMLGATRAYHILFQPAVQCTLPKNAMKHTLKMTLGWSQQQKLLNLIFWNGCMTTFLW